MDDLEQDAPRLDLTVEPVVEDKQSGREWLAARATAEIWSRLLPGEVLIELGFAHLGLPGVVAATNWRLVYLGRGYFTSARAWCSIPRSMIRTIDVGRSAGQTELLIDTTDGRRFEFTTMDNVAATRIVKTLHQARDRDWDSSEVVIETPSKRFFPLWLIAIVAAAGIGLLTVSRWLGITVITLALMAAYIDHYRISRIKRMIERRDPWRSSVPPPT